MNNIQVGSKVRWETSKNPIGTVVHTFQHNRKDYAVVESNRGVLKVVRVYEKLVACN